MIKVLTWNINGVKSLLQNNKTINRLDKIKALKVDYILLQEIRSNNESLIMELANLLDFKHYYYYSSVRPNHAGVAILTNDSKSKVDFDDNILPDEGRILVLKNSKFNLVNLYTPYIGMSKINLDKRAKWEDYLIGFLKNLNDKPLIVCGDLNVAPEKIDRYKVVDAIQPGCSEDERQWFYNLLSKTGLLDSYREYYPNQSGFTWGLYNSRLRLDYVLIRDLHCKGIEIVNIIEITDNKYLSDHYPLFATLEL